MPSEGSATRVGLTVIVALAVLATTIFLVGEKNLLFTRKNRYFIHFDSVNNLDVGGPVQLNGVNVGTVEDIILPVDMGETDLVVWVSVDRRYAARIREDSLARIQTLGLLGDKYIYLSSGTPGFAEIEPGGEISAAPATDVEKLLASGGNAVDNIVATASSLSNILGKMERGEGLLGALVSDPEGGRRFSETMDRTLEAIESVADAMQEGHGPLGRLLYDESLGADLEASVKSFQSVLAKVDHGEGILPGLLNDAAAKESLAATLSNLDELSDNFGSLAKELGTGDGLLPRLMSDEELADEVTRELKELLKRLNTATASLTEGEGTAALLLNDPSVYEAINDLLVGIDESRFLRWLLRDRQKSGIKQRYQESREEARDSEDAS